MTLKAHRAASRPTTRVARMTRRRLRASLDGSRRSVAWSAASIGDSVPGLVPMSVTCPSFRGRRADTIGPGPESI